MKADRDDAPEWLTSKPSKRDNMGAVVAGVIGVIVTLGALTLGDQAFMKNTVKNLAANSQPPKPKPVAEITRAESAPRNDWDSIVEEQARRDAMSQQQPDQHAGSDSPTFKQTVFNDQNYTPRGADNVLSSREIPKPVAQEQSQETLRVTGIKEERKLKDLCWGKEGSIERRNCRSQIGLNHRD